MLSIPEIYNEMDILLSEMNDEEAKLEVENEFAIRKDEMQKLLDAQDLQSYFEIYDEILNNDYETLLCFDLQSTDELKEYVEKEGVSFDELKTETVRATYEVLENLIFEAEEEY